MNADEISRRVVEILNSHQIPYMLVGSLSTNFHSISRSTQDADIVIPERLIETAHTIAGEFPDLRLDPQIGFESVTGTKKLMLHAADSGGFIVELFDQANDGHDRERFQRRLRVDWLGITAWIATAEDAVVTKLRWAESQGRRKDVDDARTIIAMKGQTLDWPYIENWCDQHGSRQLLERIRGELRRS